MYKKKEENFHVSYLRVILCNFYELKKKDTLFFKTKLIHI